MGPVGIDVAGKTLSPAEVEKLSHPLVGGVILFARNYEQPSQLKSLTKAIKSLRPDTFIAVDHEGGRVQRFRRGFTLIPAMADIRNKQEAFACGAVMAYELKMHGIDLSFAPVLDRDNGSDVIGDRGFSADPMRVTELAEALIDGMHSMGLPSCGKHFPGHGSVKADSHVACPVDIRAASNISEDLHPFKALIAKNKLDAVMPAHVVYAKCDSHPAGFSKYWLQKRLRDELGFSGLVFSDDLSMQGASLAGDYGQRAIQAYTAGCDFLLVCNAPNEVECVFRAMELQTLRKVDKPDWLTRAQNNTLPADADSKYNASLTVLKESEL